MFGNMPRCESPLDGDHGGIADPPDHLHPAQLGLIAVGRVTLGHLAATLVHLAQRGHLTIEKTRTERGACDWLMARATTGTDDTLVPYGAGTGDLLVPYCADPRDMLIPYEAALLDGLLPAGQRLLSSLDERAAPVLERVRELLIRDAVHSGDLRRFHPDQRTPSGDDLVLAIDAYRRDLRRLRTTRGPAALDDHHAYAILFGLDPGNANRCEGLADFAATWSQTCADLVAWPTDPPPVEHDHTIDTWNDDHRDGHSGGGITG